MTTVRVTINGTVADGADGDTVDTLVRSRAAENRHVAVALNGAVVPRSAWAATALHHGDTVEVLIPTAGG